MTDKLDNDSRQEMVKYRFSKAQKFIEAIEQLIG
jgi:hypothetical protein